MEFKEPKIYSCENYSLGDLKLIELMKGIPISLFLSLLEVSYTKIRLNPSND